jgi:hypothetical protein
MVLAQDAAQASEAQAILDEQKYQKDLAQYNKDLEKYNKEKAIYDAEVKRIAEEKAAEEKRIAEEKKAAQEKSAVYESVPGGESWGDYIKDKPTVFRGGGEGRHPSDREESAVRAIREHIAAGTLPPQASRYNDDPESWVYTRFRQAVQLETRTKQASANLQVAKEKYGFEISYVRLQPDEAKAIGNPRLYGLDRTPEHLKSPSIRKFEAGRRLRSGEISILTYQQQIGAAQTKQQEIDRLASERRSAQARAQVAGYLKADSEHWQSVANDPNTSGSNQATINSLGLSHNVQQLDDAGLSTLYNETDLANAGSMPSAANVTINSSPIEPNIPSIPVRTNTSGKKGVNEANQLQQQYVKDLREGKIGIAQALLNPQTPQSYPTRNTINTKQFLSERGYDVNKPETIPDSIFMNPQKYDDARKQASSSSQKDTTMGDLRKLIPASPQVSDAVLQQRRKAMENIAASKGGSYIGYGIDGTPIQGAPAPSVIDNTKTQWAVDSGKRNEVVLPRMDGSTYTAREKTDPLLFDTEQQAQAYIDYENKMNPFNYLSTPTPTPAEPTDGGKFMEAAYKYLDESGAGLIEDKNRGGILGRLYTATRADTVVGVAKMGLGMTIQLDNLATQTIAPYVSKTTGLNPQNQNPSRPLIQSNESGDQVIFPYNFEENRFKSGQEILSSSAEYIKKYGAGDYLASVGVAYYPGMAAVKAINPIAKTTTIVKGLVPSKNALGGKIPGDVSKTTYKLQVPSMIKSIAKPIPFRIVRPGILDAKGNPTITHTALRFGYDRASIPIGGKYKGGDFYRGQASDFEQSGLRTQSGASGTSSFETHQVSHLSEPEVKELAPLIKQGEEAGVFVKGEWDVLVTEKETALKLLKQQHKVFVNTDGEKQKFIPYEKTIDEGVSKNIGNTEKTVIKGEVAVQKKLWQMMHKSKVKDAKEKFQKQVKQDSITPPVNSQPVPTLKTTSLFKGKMKGTSSQPVNTLEKQSYQKDFSSNQATPTLNSKSFLHTKLIGTSSRPINPSKIKSLHKGKMMGTSSQPVPTLRVQRVPKDFSSNQAVPTLNTPSLHRGKFKSSNYNPTWDSHVVDMGKKKYFVPPVIKKFKESPVVVKENIPGVLTSKYLGDTPIAQNEFGMLRRMHPAIIDPNSWQKFAKTQKGLIGSMKGSGVLNFLKGGIKIDQHDIDAMKLVQNDEAQKILMEAKTHPGYAFAPKGSGVGIGKKLDDSIIEQKNIEMIQEGNLEINQSKSEFIRKANPNLTDEAVLQLEKDPMGVTKAIKSGDTFKPIDEVEDVKEIYNLVGSKEELVSATGKNPTAFYGKVRDVGDPIKIKIDGIKETILSQNLGQQNIDIKGSISGMLDENTLHGANLHTPEVAAKLFPDDVRIRYGHGLPHRHQKDVVASYFFIDRYTAQQAWKTGNKKLAREIGESMNKRYNLEKSRGMDWQQAISDRRAKGEIEFKFDKTPENLNKKEIGSSASVIQGGKSTSTNIKYTESEIDSEIRDWSRQLDQREVIVKPKSPTIRSASSPRVFSKSTFSTGSTSSFVSSSKSSFSPKSTSSPRTSPRTSPKSTLSPKSTSSPRTSPKSTLSPKSTSSPFRSPKSPFKPRSSISASPRPNYNKKSPSRTVFATGMSGSDREIVKEKKTKRKDFLASSRTDNIVGMFNRRAIIEGDKKSEKQLLKDKRFKEGKKKKKIKKKEKSFFQKHGIVNKKFKI